MFNAPPPILAQKGNIVFLGYIYIYIYTNGLHIYTWYVYLHIHTYDIHTYAHTCIIIHIHTKGPDAVAESVEHSFVYEKLTVQNLVESN